MPTRPRPALSMSVCRPLVAKVERQHQPGHQRRHLLARALREAALRGMASPNTNAPNTGCTPMASVAAPARRARHGAGARQVARAVEAKAARQARHERAERAEHERHEGGTRREDVHRRERGPLRLAASAAGDGEREGEEDPSEDVVYGGGRHGGVAEGHAEEAELLEDAGEHGERGHRSAAPTNTQSGRKDARRGAGRRRRGAARGPRRREQGHDAPAAMATLRGPTRRTERKSSSRPTRKRKSSRPRPETVSSAAALHAGKRVRRKAPHRPRADGPSKMPPWRARICISKQSDHVLPPSHFMSNFDGRYFKNILFKKIMVSIFVCCY